MKRSVCRQCTKAKHAVCEAPIMKVKGKIARCCCGPKA